ncbi:MAG TPA: redoxin family protein [Blastocatellia bacterium]|nr:redoxin family protein [Blastocatellia bacterium]
MKSAIRLGLLFLLMAIAAPLVPAQGKTDSRARELVDKAKDLIARARLDEAIAALEEAIKLKPDSPLAHQQLGRAYANKLFSGNGAQFEQKAIAALNRAIELDSSNAEAYFVLGRIDYFMKRFEQALADYERAIKADPSLAKAYAGKWRSMLKREDFEGELPKIRAEVEGLLKRTENREAMLEAAAAGYELLADEKGMKEVQERFLTEYPKGEKVEGILLDRIFRERDDRKRFGMIEAFLARYPQNPNSGLLHRILFLTRINQSDVAAEELVRLGEAWIKAASGDADSMRDARMKVIIAFAERGVALDRARELADETVKLFDEMKPDSKLLEEFDPSVRDQVIRNGRDSAHRARGFLLIKLGRTQEAAKELKTEFDPVIQEVEKRGFVLWKDMELRDIGARPRVLWLAELYEIEGDYNRAARYLLAGYGDDESSNRFIRERLQAVYKKLGRPRDEAINDLSAAEARYRSLIDKMLAQDEEARKKALAVRLAIPAPDFSVTRPDKKQARLSDFKGKVVLINFWATWCGPCHAEMSQLQKLVDRYKNEPDVIILAISTDENRAAVRPFMQKNGYTIAVAYDNNAAAGFRVEGIPTTLLIDRGGVIQFKDVGYNADEKSYLAQMVWRIDALLKEKAIESLPAQSGNQKHE